MGLAVSQVSLLAAAASGMCAATLMAGLFQGLRLTGLMRLDPLLLVGTIFAAPGPRARTIGLFWHVATGAAFGALYATLFELFAVTPGLLPGLLFGLVHGLLSGLSLGTLPFRNRRVAVGEVADPGLFAANLGWTDGAFLTLAHALYGGSFALLFARLSAP